MSNRTTGDAYDGLPARTKPAKGEKAAVLRYLEAEESLALRQDAVEIGEDGGRALLQGAIVVLVTDRKFVAARSSGGFRPSWEVFTLPYGHLEPGVAVRGDAGTEVFVPTSGRRSYRVQLAEPESATALSRSLGDALRAYRRDRMGLQDP